MRKKQSGSFIKKLTMVIIICFFTLLTACNENRTLTTTDEGKMDESTAYSKEIETISKYEELDDEYNKIIIDEDNLLNGYWIAYSRANYIAEYDSEKIPNVYLVEFVHGEGMLFDLNSNNLRETYNDFVFTDINDGVQRGVGQKFESDMIGKHSRKSELAAVQIDEKVTLMKTLVGDSPSVIYSYILERISENDYNVLKEQGRCFSISEKEKIVDCFNKMNDTYSIQLKKYFGTNFEWYYGDADSFGELGRGNDLQLDENQLEKFKGDFFFIDQAEYDQLFYSLSPLQDNFYLNKDDAELGIIILQSKSGIIDNMLYEENLSAEEAKNSFVNLLMKTTENYDFKVNVKVIDSQGDAYLGFSSGRIVFDRLKKQRNFEEIKAR